MDENNENVENNIGKFLEELTALSQKYRIAIEGCDCEWCPRLVPMDAVIGSLRGNLDYDGTKEKYTVEVITDLLT